MDRTDLLNEVIAYRDVLANGNLTELDMDALCHCLGETAAVLEERSDQSDEAKTLRSAIASDIVKLVGAGRALIKGRNDLDLRDALERLQRLPALNLLNIRQRAASVLAGMSRQGRLPLRAIPGAASAESTLRDYIMKERGSVRPSTREITPRKTNEGEKNVS